MLLQVPINSSLVYSSPIIHHVQLENLLPNQTYTYSVGDGGGNSTQALEFMTTGLQPPTSTVRCEQQQAEPLWQGRAVHAAALLRVAWSSNMLACSNPPALSGASSSRQHV